MIAALMGVSKYICTPELDLRFSTSVAQPPIRTLARIHIIRIVAICIVILLSRLLRHVTSTASRHRQRPCDVQNASPTVRAAHIINLRRFSPHSHHLFSLSRTRNAPATCISQYTYTNTYVYATSTRQRRNNDDGGGSPLPCAVVVYSFG